MVLLPAGRLRSENDSHEVHVVPLVRASPIGNELIGDMSRGDDQASWSRQSPIKG